MILLLCKKSHKRRAKTITNWISKTYKATVVLKWCVSGVNVIIFFCIVVILKSEAQNLFKSVLFMVRQTQVLLYFPFATSSSVLETQFFIIADLH